ncbi:MAG TPA: RNA polymerase sigma factor, partial [Kofleriaceae bacterium]|nr:RNA polymerase sigma factor [Kofleriaceae bacterium]
MEHIYRSEDRDILALVDAGNTNAALRLLMQRYSDAVRRYCLSMVQDPTLTDDLHQNIFMAALDGLARFARRCSLRSWLFAIAHHCVADTLRRRYRRPHVSCNSLGAAIEVPDPGPTPAESLDER